MTEDDHAAEVDALRRRFPGWAVWFGPYTRRWWALPPGHADRFVEADTPQRLIAQVESLQTTMTVQFAPSVGTARADRTPNARPDERRPSNLLRVEGRTASPSAGAPVVAWPGAATR